MPAVFDMAVMPLLHRKSSREAIAQEIALNILNGCAGMAHAGSSSKRLCQMSAITEQQA